LDWSGSLCRRHGADDLFQRKGLAGRHPAIVLKPTILIRVYNLLKFVFTPSAFPEPL
jgi:hypothetical protein